ncbi:MAG: radical SAM family heme chaperone HemW [Planctomycetota bacterium]|nr:radical SAM family heme chaperone HemW [Planctomycetota bacterium]
MNGKDVSINNSSTPAMAIAGVESRPQALMTARAVYVHVPFCLHHCGYCDFALVANRDQLIPQYLQALDNELSAHRRLVGDLVDVDSIFVGGGTPTHLSPETLQSLFTLIHQHFRPTANAEISVEANPDGLDDDRLDVLRSNGVNRLSLGVQSFDDAVLKTLERTHTGTQAIETVRRCQQWFPNVSLDLIFGVPGQTIESWQQTLDIAMTLPVKHVSTYGLTFEKDTPFFRREQHGQLKRTPDELERQMYLDAITKLTRIGLRHYEVSNFAQQGFVCRHNMVYWNAEEYFAFGPGAASYLNGIRRTNTRSVVRWLKSWQQDEATVEDCEELSNEEKAREAIMLALRMRQGLNVPAFESRFGLIFAELAGASLQQHIDHGFLVQHADFVSLTTEGLLIADTIIADFL